MMNVKKKLIELLRSSDSIYNVNVADHLLAHGVTVQKRGRWEPTDMGGGETDEAFTCSACGEAWVLIDGTPIENNMHYCPHCGAKMDLEG